MTATILVTGGAGCIGSHMVKDVIETCRQVTRQGIRHRIAGRRAVNPARLVVGVARARAQPGWSPAFTEFSEIAATAWRWFSREAGC